MQYIRLTTYYHIFVEQLMIDFCLFQSNLLSQNGNKYTIFWKLFVIMTEFFPQIISFSCLV